MWVLVGYSLWISVLILTWCICRYKYDPYLKHSLQDFVREKCNGRDSSHDYKHHLRVAENVKIYAIGWLTNHRHQSIIPGYSNERAIKILDAAAWIHDIIDHKYVTTDDMKNQLLRAINSELQYQRFKDDEIKGIMFMISNMSWSKEHKIGFPELPKELRNWKVALILLMDADRREAIGLGGIQRCKVYTKAMNPEMTEDEVIKMVKKHIDEKLRKLHGTYIRTETALSDCAIPHAKMIEWYNNN